jgi:hypothetical protein
VSKLSESGARMPSIQSPGAFAAIERYKSAWQVGSPEAVKCASFQELLSDLYAERRPELLRD